jgi:bifunctional UDP-N-acetylglucosamine pyrophosphorylase / glucosamine-1-phosphate N-acetyltransferase
LNIVVLAAGLGKRMASPRPKLLHPLGGRPLLEHVIMAAKATDPGRLIIVVGHGSELLKAAFPDIGLTWVEQKEQLGTGDAVRHALTSLGDDPVTLVVNGDVPLIQPSTLKRLAEASGGTRLALLTVVLADPSGYGRVVRNTNGAIEKIVEHKDADAKTRALTEINTGIMAIPSALLPGWIKRLTNVNAQSEFYLTDIFALAHADGVEVISISPESIDETLGVNTQLQLVEVERRFQRRQAEVLLAQGVMLADANRIEQRGSLACGQEVAIDINCIFEGDVRLGNRVHIGAHCFLRDLTVDDDAIIEPYSFLDGAHVGAGARVGPYARLRPGTRIGPAAHIGNFVEVKNSDIGANSKANHLSYVGDATVGERVNLGAGTITCNYDGANKHRTVIGDDVQIGSDVQLVAPLTVGSGATVGAGTTVWKDVEPDTLVTNPKSQNADRTWRRPKKN